MTRFERIKSMDVDEISEAAVYELRIFVMADPSYMSLLDATCYSTRELAIAHNKEWLNGEYRISPSSPYAEAIDTAKRAIAKDRFWNDTKERES